jgi:hypothetical protein
MPCVLQSYVEAAVERASDSNLADGDIVSAYDEVTGVLAQVRITRAEVAEDAKPLSQATSVVSSKGGGGEAIVREGL